MSGRKKQYHLLKKYKVLMTDQRLCTVSVCQCLQVSKIKSLVQFLAVPNILDLTGSILWSEFSKRWLVTSAFLHLFEPGCEKFFSTMVLQIYYVTTVSNPYSALTLP